MFSYLQVMPVEMHNPRYIGMLCGAEIASPVRALSVAFFASLVQRAGAQAPVNDAVSWPSGMMVLATVLYAGYGSSLDHLWAIEPAAGLFLFTGLPLVSMWGMDRVSWTYKACHFVSRVRPAVGSHACWVPAERVSEAARDAALKRVEKVLSCVRYTPSADVTITSAWELRPTGLLYPATAPPVTTRAIPRTNRDPSARDYLLFAAIAFQLECELDATVYSSSRHNVPLFSTRGSPWGCMFDVDSVEMAELVVAANMARRPSDQSRLHMLATRKDSTLMLDIDAIGDDPVCSIDFNSHAPRRAKVSATLRELAEAYYVVLQRIKTNLPAAPSGRSFARANCNGALWTAILGGEFLTHGRVTVEHLASKYMEYDAADRDPRRRADNVYTSTLEGVLEELRLAGLVGEEHAADFDAILDHGGIARAAAAPFLVTGVLCQALVCFFLSVGTNAGLWTSVAMANALFAGRLTDLHSVWCSRRTEGEDLQPGLKMRVPGTERLLVVATLNRSAPAHATLRPGLLLNAASFIAAIIGSTFQTQTRRGLGFSAFQPAQVWMLYSEIGLALAVSVLLLGIAFRRWIAEDSWRKVRDLPDRIIVLFTVPESVLVSALALYFHRTGQGRMWPILDAITFLSGLPLGMVENGEILSVDENMCHLVLLNRWVMGAVASSLGRGVAGTILFRNPLSTGKQVSITAIGAPSNVPDPSLIVISTMNSHLLHNTCEGTSGIAISCFKTTQSNQGCR